MDLLAAQSLGRWTLSGHPGQTRHTAFPGGSGQSDRHDAGATNQRGNEDLVQPGHCFAGLLMARVAQGHATVSLVYTQSFTGFLEAAAGLAKV